MYNLISSPAPNDTEVIAGIPRPPVNMTVAILPPIIVPLMIGSIFFSVCTKHCLPVL
jgi:hypothetical protein